MQAMRRSKTKHSRFGHASTCQAAAEQLAAAAKVQTTCSKDFERSKRALSLLYMSTAML